MNHTRSHAHQPPAKKARIGPAILDHASENQYNSFLNRELDQELALRAKKHESELVLQSVKAELSMVTIFKEAYEEIGFFESREKVGLADIVAEIQRRAFARND